MASHDSSPGEHRDSGSEVLLAVAGMMCGSCVKRVTDALLAVDGVVTAHVTLDRGGEAVVLGTAPVEELIQAVAGVGKTATLSASADKSPDTPSLSSMTCSVGTNGEPAEGKPKDSASGESLALVDDVPETPLGTKDSVTSLAVGGMTCSSCVSIVEDILRVVPGVASVRVSLLSARATVIHASKDLKPAALVDAVVAGGYRCQLLSAQGNSSNRRAVLVVCESMEKAKVVLDILRASDAVLVAVERSDVCGVGIELSESADIASVLRKLERDTRVGPVRLAIPEPGEDHRWSSDGGVPAVSSRKSRPDNADGEAAIWRSRFALACFFTIPLMVLGFLAHHTSLIPQTAFMWASFALASPVQFVCGHVFYRASYYSLRKRRATMDVLIALSTTVAYFTSLAVVLLTLLPSTRDHAIKTANAARGIGHSSMFNVSAMIITIVTLGKWLEATAKRRAAAGVASLSALVPKDAVLFDGTAGIALRTRVPVALLHVGDLVRVAPGERVPVDALVKEGHSAVDESMLTGESYPVPKTVSDFVYGGTINGGGSMLLCTSAVEDDAVLAQIVKLVDDAQTCRAPIEAYADRVSAYFVPGVVALSVFVFCAWFFLAATKRIPIAWFSDEGSFIFALLFALETMVIACPCALGLATPTAVMVASEVGTRLGVLVRGGGAALEAAQKVNTVLFDKTGTLTMGKPQVSAVVVGTQKLGNGTARDSTELVCRLVQLAEAESRHPLAAAVLDYIDQNVNCASASPAFETVSVEEFPGRGVSAIVQVPSRMDGLVAVDAEKFHVRVGSRSWALDNLEQSLLTSQEVDLLNRLEQEDALTIVAAVVNGSHAVLFGLSDMVRPEAADVVAFLQNRMGIACSLVTGDSEATAIAVARQVGIDPSRVVSRAMPWTKVNVIRDLPSGTSCFVGDGINDAPALAAADVSIAVGAGAPIAAENASIVLVRSDLNGVVQTIDLARTSFSRVRLNLALALGYNVLCIPLAAGILFPLTHFRIPPVMASASMALSSSCVVLSSLALRWYKPPCIDAVSSSRDRGARAHDLRGREMRRRDSGPTYVLVDEESEDLVASPQLVR